METMTRDEWENLHPDYRLVREDGQHYRLRLERDTGVTVLVPVEVVDEEAEEET